MRFWTFLSVLVLISAEAAEPLSTSALRGSVLVEKDAEGLYHRQDSRGREIVYANAVLVKLAPGAEPEPVLDTFTPASRERIAADLYRITVTSDALEVAKALEQLPEVRYAHPDFHTPKRLR